MNREDIIRMAKEAGAIHIHGNPKEFALAGNKEIERFAALVAAHALVEPCCGNYDQCQKVCMPRAANAERQAIAQMIEDAPALMEFAQNEQGGCLMCGFTPKLAAKTIRARGQA